MLEQLRDPFIRRTRNVAYIQYNHKAQRCHEITDMYFLKKKSPSKLKRAIVNNYRTRIGMHILSWACVIDVYSRKSRGGSKFFFSTKLIAKPVASHDISLVTGKTPPVSRYSDERIIRIINRQSVFINSHTYFIRIFLWV